MSFTIVSTLDSQEYQSATKQIKRPGQMRVGLLILLVIGILSLQLLGNEDLTKKTGFFFPVIIGLCIFIFVRTFSARKSLNDLPALPITTRYTFSDEGVKAEGNGQMSDTAWKAFHKVIWTTDFLLLYYSSNIAMPIPASLFTEEQKSFIANSRR